MKAYEVIKRNKEEYESLKKSTPWDTMRAFENLRFEVHGDQISFGGDFLSLSEARSALKFLIDQLGGKVLWQK